MARPRPSRGLATSAHPKADLARLRGVQAGDEVRSEVGPFGAHLGVREVRPGGLLARERSRVS